MSIRQGWDKFETALLIDACEKVAAGAAKKPIVIKLSADLRQRAILSGNDIDDLFRNENGIALQMNKMDYFLSDGAKGLPGGSKFFSDMVAFKRANPQEFSLILREAKDQTNFERNEPSVMNNTRSRFEEWLKAQGKLKMHMGTILSVMDESSEYAKQHGISRTAFWDMDDPAVFIAAYRKLSSNRLFRVFKRSTAQTLDKVYSYFKDFLGTVSVSDTEPASDSSSSTKKSNLALQDRVYAALKDLSTRMNLSASVLSIYEICGGSLPEIKDILDHASWATESNGKYQFSEPVIDNRHTEESTSPSSASEVATVTPKTEEAIPVRAISKSVNFEDNFLSWMREKHMADTTARSYLSSIRSAETYAKEKGIEGISLTSSDGSKALASIEALLSNKDFIQYNRFQNNRFGVAFRKLRDFIAETGRRESQITSDTELEIKNSALYHKLYSVSKVYDDPRGLTIDRIHSLIGNMCEKAELIEFLDRISWATKLSHEVYTFSKAPITTPLQISEEQEKPVNNGGIPSDFDKDAFIGVLMRRYQSGMQFDSIDLENFRDTYEDMYDEKLTFSDEELVTRLKLCGIQYMDRLFPAEGIIDTGTKERLFAYIENTFAAGNAVLYYKAIFTDLSDAFAYCFSLTDETMLKAYIEYTAEKGKYFFRDTYMSIEENVVIDHLAEIENFMLSAGKPLSYDEMYEGLSHISKDIIYREIRLGTKFVMNEKEHYFHIDLFEFSDSESEQIAAILNSEIEYQGYVIWSTIFPRIQEQMPVFLENNLYLSPLGIRNALSRFMAERFDFDGEVISPYGSHLGMADVFRLYAKHNAPFSDTELYDFAKVTDTVIYFWALAEETVRVSKTLFVAKNQIEFDIEATDKALETYLSSGYILVKDVDSFLVFPNVGYEWNEFLLESYLLYFSKKFCLVNNGTSLNNVAGAVAKRDGQFTQFVDICAQALADSGIELKKAVALNYLAEINLITRRSYRDIEIAMTKARQIRNRKG